MGASTEFKLNVYHVESRDGRLGPYHLSDSDARFYAKNYVFDSLFGETIGGSRGEALGTVIRGWLSGNAKTLADGEKQFDGSDDEFYVYVQRIDDFIAERSISIAHNEVDFGTKAFNEAFRNYLYKHSTNFFNICKSIIDSANVGKEPDWFEIAYWIGNCCNLSRPDIQKEMREGSCPAQLVNLSWDDYVSCDYDQIFRNMGFHIAGGPKDSSGCCSLSPRDKSDYFKKYITGPEGLWIRTEFNDIKLGVIGACKNRRAEQSVPSSASSSSGKISQQQMFAMMMAPNGRCPKCNCPLSTRKVGLNAKKAAFGGILAGPVGAIVGASSGRTEYYCENCGYTR